MNDSTIGLLAACIDRARHQGRSISVEQAIREVEALSPSHAAELRRMRDGESRCALPLAA